MNRIGDEAFYLCSSLIELTIPNAETRIDDNAFCFCASLSRLTSLNTNPPTCGKYRFEGVSKITCVLYVPLGTTKFYSTATGWKDFFNIEEIDTSGIEVLTLDGAEIEGYYTQDGKHLNAPQHGINILRYSDSTTKKVLIK